MLIIFSFIRGQLEDWASINRWKPAAFLNKNKMITYGTINTCWQLQNTMKASNKSLTKKKRTWNVLKIYAYYISQKNILMQMNRISIIWKETWNTWFKIDVLWRFTYICDIQKNMLYWKFNYHNFRCCLEDVVVHAYDVNINCR